MEARRGALPWAHPRACGENPSPMPDAVRCLGSSPRVRGKPTGISTGILDRGLIPARAGKTAGAASPPTCTRAHPRACGENAGGCSPLPMPARLIPARAGKTWTSSVPGRSETAHPRACGENGAGADPDGVLDGSSPRVRGKLPRRRGAAAPHRLIPARAGKTSALTLVASLTRAHPRACGENIACPFWVVLSEGSSPRVRGKLRWRFLLVGFPGLIPARAGKTQRHRPPPGHGRAHPRACGENGLAVGGSSGASGSSPRVRGKRLMVKSSVADSGLIPARAGKTRPPHQARRRQRAHPRACGENHEHARMNPFARGSSPRVRGKRVSGWWRRGVSGLIPARAGKTPSAPRKGRQSPAHPRACGENVELDCLALPGAGSSPRVRGKRHWRDPLRKCAGLIPARAGKTRARHAGIPPSPAHPRACGENSCGASAAPP